MKKFAIAALATTALAVQKKKKFQERNLAQTAVQDNCFDGFFAQLEQPDVTPQRILAQTAVPPPRILDAMTYDDCLRIAPWYDCKHNDEKQLECVIKTGKPCEKEELKDPISTFSDLTGITVPRFFRHATGIVANFHEVYEKVHDEKETIAFDMLVNFEKYYAVMELYCTQNSCNGNVDRMRDAFETVSGMSEEDIDFAIKVYNIADFHDIVLLESQKIMNELVEIIANEIGLERSVVEYLVRQAKGDFDTFLNLLQ